VRAPPSALFTNVVEEAFHQVHIPDAGCENPSSLIEYIVTATTNGWDFALTDTTVRELGHEKVSPL
jgi:hypothetical protein